MPYFTSRDGAISAYREVAPDNVPGGGLGDDNVRMWAALLDFQRQRGITGDALEIGVWHGFSAAYIAGHLEDTDDLVLVDKFMREQHFRPTFGRMLGQQDRPLHFFPQDSFDLKAETDFAAWRGKMRFLHIDGEHSREAVENDLALAEKLVSADGVIAVDDILYFHTPQVSHGLFSYLGREGCGLKPFLFAYNKCYLARAESHAFYRDFALTVIDFLEAEGQLYNCAFSHRRLDPDYVGISRREYGLQKYAYVNRGFDSFEDLKAFAASGQ